MTIAALTGRALQGQYLELARKMEEAHQDTMCRARYECFWLDMTGRPVIKIKASKIVRQAIYGGIPSGRKRRRNPCWPMGGHKDKTPLEDAGGSAEADQLASFECILEWLRANEEHARAVVRGGEGATVEYECAVVELGLLSIDEVCHHMDQDWK